MDIQGKYGTAIVYNDMVEQEAISQIITLLNQPMAQDAHVRIMPDVHAGAGCVIGYTAKLTDKVVPNLVGVDIGCGVLSYELYDSIGVKELDNFVRQNIAVGHNVNDTADLKKLPDELKVAIHLICVRTGQDEGYVLRSLGSLGGGNHFLELGTAPGKRFFLSAHSGSRNFGLKIANFHQAEAVRLCEVNSIAAAKDNFILNVAKGGIFQDWELKAHLAAREKVTRGLEYLEGRAAQLYYQDMEIAQWFADLNRRLMLDKIVEHFKLHVESEVHSVHNYIDFRAGILRKGAISAQSGEDVVIPLNMRDGMIIGKGRGNKEWNYSAPHGAGRLMARGQARRTLSLDDFKESMKGIYSTCISESTLDESPMAYKDAKEILQYIEPTVDVVDLVKPIWNFKG